MSGRYVHITPRLSAALDLLCGSDAVADVGCDHGRLTAALLQSGVCRYVVASDISEPSLEKARALIGYIGKRDSVSFRVGDGLSVLSPGECDAIAILGMGGTLMCRILDACRTPLSGARFAVLQPMRAQDDIRRYLYANNYHVVDDRIVVDHGRYYQVLKAVPTEAPDRIPDAFPADFWDVGYKCFADRDPLLVPYCRYLLSIHDRMKRDAIGSEGEERLNRKISALQTIIEQF